MMLEVLSVDILPIYLVHIINSLTFEDKYNRNYSFKVK